METLDQMDLKGFYRTFHPNVAEYVLFLPHMDLSQGETICWGHETYISIYLRILK